MGCHPKFGQNSDCECKFTLMKRGFANFLAKKVEKVHFLSNFGWKMMIYWNEYAGVLSMAQKNGDYGCCERDDGGVDESIQSIQSIHIHVRE